MESTYRVSECVCPGKHLCPIPPMLRANEDTVVIFLVLGIPESPRWLYYHDRHDDARKVLCDVWNGEFSGPRINTQERYIFCKL